MTLSCFTSPERCPPFTVSHKVECRNNNNWYGINLISLKKNHHSLTVLSSWRSCWFRFVDSSKRASRAAIFSSFISRDFLSVDSSFDSKSLYLLVNDTTHTYTHREVCILKDYLRYFNSKLFWNSNLKATGKTVWMLLYSKAWRHLSNDRKSYV